MRTVQLVVTTITKKRPSQTQLLSKKIPSNISRRVVKPVDLKDFPPPFKHVLEPVGTAKDRLHHPSTGILKIKSSWATHRRRRRVELSALFHGSFCAIHSKQSVSGNKIRAR